MPHLYLAPWQWNTSGDPGIDYWDAPVAQSCLQRIDLRPLAAQAEPGGVPQGYGLFVYDRQVSIPGATYFGSEVKRSLTQRERDAWQGLLNISEAVEGITLEDVLWNTLTLHAQPSGQDRVRPLMPRARGDLELSLPAFGLVRRKTPRPGDAEWASVVGVLQSDYRRLRGELTDAYPEGDPRREHYKKLLGTWRLKYRVSDHLLFIPPDLPDEGWLPPSTTITESFNTTDGDTLGPDLSWTELSGDWDIVTNAAEHITGSIALARADSDLSGDDHYSQLKLLNPTNGASHKGVIARKDSSATLTYYHADYLHSSGNIWRTLRRVAGTFTAIGSNTQVDGQANDIIKLEVDGSTIKRYRNGLEQDSTTDTNITGNTRCGISSGSTGVRVDEFEAADLTIGGFAHSQAVMVG